MIVHLGTTWQAREEVLFEHQKQVGKVINVNVIHLTQQNNIMYGNANANSNTPTGARTP